MHTFSFNDSRATLKNTTEPCIFSVEEKGKKTLTFSTRFVDSAARLAVQELQPNSALLPTF